MAAGKIVNEFELDTLERCWEAPVLGATFLTNESIERSVDKMREIESVNSGLHLMRGPARPTDAMSAEQLKAIGYVGIYQPVA